MRRFELVEGGSRKFWEAETREAALFVHWGRLGTAGRQQLKEFESPERTEKELGKLVAQKLKKGYREVGAATVAASPASPRARVSPPPRVEGVAPISAAPAARAARPVGAYTVETVVEAGKHPALVLGIASFGKEAIAVGGQGRDLVLHSRDGNTWSVRKSGGHGLRGVLMRENGEIYVVGEYGYAAVSRDRGRSWQKIFRQPRPWHKGEAPCLFAAVEDEEGRVWTAGDSGYLGRLTPEGDQLEPLHLVDEHLGRIRATPLGLLLPTDAGHLFVVKDEAATKLPLNAKAMLMAVAMTLAGSIIVAGLGGALYRIPAGSKRAVKLPAPEVMLTGVDVLSDGQVLVVGEGGLILASSDDGESFAPAKYRSKKTLWCCRAHGDGALIGGEQGLILRYRPA